jgi:hypothetical protein
VLYWHADGELATGCLAGCDRASASPTLFFERLQVVCQDFDVVAYLGLI